MLQSNSIQNNIYAGTAYIYSFPFWLFINTSSHLSIKIEKIGDQKVRIYPPFRCGVPNFIPMPHVDLKKIPFLEGVNKNLDQFKIIHAVAYPLLEVDEEGKTAIFITDMNKWDELINPFPMDCLRIDIFRKEKEDRSNVAKEIIRKLLDLIRCYTKQWWINHSVDALLGYQRCNFPITEKGKILENPWSGGNTRTISGDQRPLDTDLWRRVITDLSNGCEPPTYDLLLLDARYFSSVGDIKRSVLDLTMACEQALESTIQRIWKLRIPGKALKIKTILPSDDLLDNIGKNLKRFTKHSYQEEESAKFSIIKNLWLTRNNVAHGGQAQYNFDAKIVIVNEDITRDFYEASQGCIRWLEGL